MQHEERMIEEQENQPLSIPTGEAHEHRHVGAVGIVGIIVVVLLIAISAATLFNSRSAPFLEETAMEAPIFTPPTEEPQDPTLQALTVQSDSTEIDAIDGDIQATDLDSIDTDFADLEKELDVSVEEVR